MTTHRPIISTGEFYHLYNKSIANTIIFDKNSLEKVIQIVDFYRYNQRIKLSKFNLLSLPIQQVYLNEIKSHHPVVDIFSFSFMPNHYHFLVKQLQDKGIHNFMSNFQNSYAKCFNLINNRIGSLFLKNFKLKRITSEEQFIHVCRYIHINHVTSYIIEFDQLTNYPFSSYSWYLNKNLNRFVNTDLMMNHFKTKDRFIKFHQNQVDYQRRLKEIKDLLLDG